MLQANIRKRGPSQFLFIRKSKMPRCPKGLHEDQPLIYESYCEGTQITKIDKMGDGFMLLLIVDWQTPFSPFLTILFPHH